MSKAGGIISGNSQAVPIDESTSKVDMKMILNPIFFDALSLLDVEGSKVNNMIGVDAIGVESPMGGDRIM